MSYWAVLYCYSGLFAKIAFAIPIDKLSRSCGYCVPITTTVQRAPLPPGKPFNLQHREVTVTCEALTEANTAENCSFTTDRKESRHESDGATPVRAAAQSPGSSTNAPAHRLERRPVLKTVRRDSGPAISSLFVAERFNGIDPRGFHSG